MQVFPDDIAKKPTTEEEERNLAAAYRWIALFNGDDMAHFVAETYHEDIRLTLFDGTSMIGEDVTLTDATTFVELENFIKKFCPGRKLEIRRAIPAGHVVTLELMLRDDARPDFALANVTILTFRDGKIISDHSYVNTSDWPGAKEAMSQ